MNHFMSIRWHICCGYDDFLVQKLASIPNSAFYSDEHKHLSANLVRFCFFKARSMRWLLHNVVILSLLTTVVMILNCQLLSMNSPNETLWYVRFLIMCNFAFCSLVLFSFLLHCTHVRMSYVLNCYLLTYLLIYLLLTYIVKYKDFPP